MNDKNKTTAKTVTGLMTAENFSQTSAQFAYRTYSHSFAFCANV